MTRRIRTILVATSLAAGTWLPVPAPAFVVYDPTNFGANLLSTVRQFQSNLHEAEVIAHQLESLANEARNLARLPLSIETQLTQDLGRLSELLAATRGLVLDYAALQTQFDALYPDAARYTGFTGRDYAQQALKWRAQNLRSVNDAMRAQGLVRTQPAAGLDLTELVRASQRAEGQLQALQAGNQIAAMLVTQMMRLEQVVSTASRAQASALAQAASDQAAGEANLTRALTDWATTTPRQPLTANPALR